MKKQFGANIVEGNIMRPRKGGNRTGSLGDGNGMVQGEKEREMHGAV